MSLWEDTKSQLVHHQNRSAQDKLFEEVLERLDNNRVVGMEGPTGTGKSLFAAAAIRMFPRVIMSPQTKAQQDALEFETVRRMLALMPGGYVVLKGRGNYICLRRARKAGLKIGLRGDGQRREYPEITSMDWELANSSSDAGCSDRACGVTDAYQLARDRAEGASLVITNQSILALDFRLGGGKILGDTSETILLLDEAHLFPGVFSGVLGGTLTVRRIELAGKAVVELDKKDTTSPDPLNEAAEELSFSLSQLGPDRRWEKYTFGETIYNRLREVREILGARCRSYRDRHQDVPPDLQGAFFRLHRLVEDAYFLTMPVTSHAVYTKKETRAVVVEARQYDVTDACSKLFDQFARAVPMSATMLPLSAQLLGFPNYEWPLIEGQQPFDLAANRLAYQTRKRTSRRGPHQWDEAELVELVTAARGRTLVIATANTQKDRAAAVLRDAGFRVGVQTGGGESVPPLIARLKAGEIDVLVGVDSVGTGVDVPGDALSLVILLSAFNPNSIGDLFLRLWGDAFPPGRAWPELFSKMAYQKLEQAIGRLIRTPVDRGVVAFLDPRANETSLYRGAVAPSRTTQLISDVAEFLS